MRHGAWSTVLVAKVELAPSHVPGIMILGKGGRGRQNRTSNCPVPRSLLYQFMGVKLFIRRSAASEFWAVIVLVVTRRRVKKSRDEA